MENLLNWHDLAQAAGYILLGLSAVYLLFYFGVTAVITDRSSKYKFISARETSVLWHVTLALLVAGALFLNSVIVGERDLNHTFALVLKIALPLALLTMVGYAMYMYLKVYYPYSLDRKLSGIRFKEKLSVTGKPMRLLNEEEEDAFLTKEMIKQEDIAAFDFDVWFDDETGMTVIEKYPGDARIRMCPNCNFKTLKLKNEELVPSTVKSGGTRRVKHFECTYCEYEDKEEKEFA